MIPQATTWAAGQWTPCPKPWAGLCPMIPGWNRINECEPKNKHTTKPMPRIHPPKTAMTRIALAANAMGGLVPLIDSDTMEEEIEVGLGIDMMILEARRLLTRDFHREDIPALRLHIVAMQHLPDLPLDMR